MAELETLACCWSYTDEVHVIRNVRQGEITSSAYEEDLNCGLFLAIYKHKMTSYHVITDVTKKGLCIFFVFGKFSVAS